jgi:hypothetical protein
MPTNRRSATTAAATAILVCAIVAGLVIAGLVVFNLAGQRQPAPARQHCVAESGDHTTGIDLAQARYASVIAGISVRRRLPARAASIALTTALTESKLHNLDHGDRDSVGLFQQRPSQGWGSKSELMDPYYATNQFYDRLVKIKHWQSANIAAIAQRIQISGNPSAYRDHEQDGRVLASVLTGHSKNSIRCLVREQHSGDARGLARSLRKTYGITPRRTGSSVSVPAKSHRLARIYAQYAVANARSWGLVSAQVGRHRWKASSHQLAKWRRTRHPIGKSSARLTVRSQ